MKVLIADDEYLVRSSLTSMLNELKLPIEIIGEATNGEELVELVKKQTPDLVFVDIRMPELNGLDAIKNAGTYSPNTQWVILTGFSEFDYAKEAIKLGATNYLLKPASPQEIKEVLVSSLKRYKDKNALLNKEFENELMALIHDLIPYSDDDETSIIGKAKFLGAIFAFDSNLNEKEKTELQIKFCNTIRTDFNEILTHDVRLALFPMPSGEWAVVGAWGFTQANQGENVIKRCIDLISRIALKFNTDHFTITILRTDVCKSYGILNNRLEQLQTLSYNGRKLSAETIKDECSSRDMTHKVITFIEQNYMLDIGIAQIAEQLNITPNYLSFIFHKKTGSTYMKHLTSVRMLKARELLSNPNAQVQLVAEKVGYFSTRHFTKLFKEYFGYYPSECRDSYQNKKQ